MKKILTLILAVLMLMSSVLSSFPASAATYGYILGDADDNDKVNIADVITMRYFIAGLIGKKDISFNGANVNIDDQINMKDVVDLRYILAGVVPADKVNPDKLYKVDQIKIAGRNISRYTIVFPDEVDETKVYQPTMQYAMGLLSDYINEACGIKLNICKESMAPKGYKIRFVYDDDDSLELGKEGFAFEEKDGDFTITCGTQRGALYAVYTFLEDFVGYRFLPGKVKYLYENSVLNIPEGYSDRQVPGFEYRGINMAGVDPEAFVELRVNALDGGGRANDWNGGGLGTLYIHAHSFAYQMYIFEEKYSSYANDFTNEYHMSQPCMTDEETYEKILDFNFRLIEEREKDGWNRFGYHYTQISCSTNDNTNYCPCDRCKAIYETEGSVSGAVIRLANRVAEAMCAVYPELDIYTIAYAGGNVPPRHTRPNENVCVCFCTTGCNNHSLRNTEECERCGGNQRMYAPIYYGGPVETYANAKDMGYLEAWREMTDNLYFWYYSANYNYFMAPAANLFNFYDDIKYLAELGVIGIYAEGSSEPVHYNFEYLRTYLISKVLWDPFMSEEEYEHHMDEFLMIYYGDGWESIKEYIFMSNYASDINGCWTNNHDSLWDIYNEEYFRDNYKTMAALLDAAYKATDDPDQRARVELTSVHAHFLGLAATYERDWVNGDAETKAEYLERYKWMWNYYNDNAYDEKNNPMGIKGTVFGDKKANFKKFPASENDVKNPLYWIDDNFDGHAGRWDFPFGNNYMP